MTGLAAVGVLSLSVLTALVLIGGFRTVQTSRWALLVWGVAVACIFLSLGIRIGAPA